MALRFLKSVRGFPFHRACYIDKLSRDALIAVAPPSGVEKIHRLEKEWHRPQGDVAVLEERLQLYGGERPSRCTEGDYLAILRSTMEELAPRERIIPSTLGAAELNPKFPKTTSPGFPYVHQGFKTKGDVLNDPIAMGRIHGAWRTIGEGKPWSLPDSLAYHRVVASPKEKSKIRPVWGYPLDVVLEEARYFYPLFEELKVVCNERDTFYGIGMETALSGHAHLSRHMRSTGVLAGLFADMSNFDALVPDWLIRDVFSHMSDWFDFTRVRDSEGKIWPVNEDKTARRWRAMVSYFLNTKVRTPSGIRFQKFQGVPSGSCFTNVMDTICNAVMMRLSLRRVTGFLPIKDFYYGDDSAVFVGTPLSLADLASELLRTFGGVLSVEKTIYTDNEENIHWLGYYYRDGLPIRDLDFIIASTLFPEREVEGPIDSASRLLGQMYSTMHPHWAVVFADAVAHLRTQHKFSYGEVISLIRSRGSKSVKFLTTLGLTVEDIVQPDITTDPFGSRRVEGVLPKPSSRSFFRNFNNLPPYAFIPEAYAAPSLRRHSFYSKRLSYHEIESRDHDVYHGHTRSASWP